MNKQTNKNPQNIKTNQVTHLREKEVVMTIIRKNATVGILQLEVQCTITINILERCMCPVK